MKSFKYLVNKLLDDGYELSIAMNFREIYLVGYDRANDEELMFPFLDVSKDEMIDVLFEMNIEFGEID